MKVNFFRSYRACYKDPLLNETHKLLGCVKSYPTFNFAKRKGNALSWANMRSRCKKSGKIFAPLTKRFQSRSVIEIIKEYETNLLKKNFKDLENSKNREKITKNTQEKRKNPRNRKTANSRFGQKLKFRLQF